MSRWEFMRQLEELLSDISPNEREEALQYYNDYFNDAGRENEQEVIEALGSPQQVAKIVRDGLGENENLGEFTERGFKNSSVQPQNAIMRRNTDGRSHEETGQQTENGGQNKYAQDEKRQTETGQTTDNQNTGSQNAGYSYTDNPGNGGKQSASESKEGMPAWAIVLIVIGCIFLSPVILGVAASALAAVVSLFVGLFAVVLGIGIAMAVLFVVALALVIAGFGTLIPHPISGMGLIGGGCICAALGILFLLLLVFLLGKCIPGICQGIGYICKKLFGKKGGAA